MNLKDAGIYDLVNIFKGQATSLHCSSQGGIINPRSRTINIPAYQRPYRWGTDKINRLFQDYDDNNSEYFLGSAVAVEKNKNGNLEFDVVDGQQRITTLYLLNYIRFLLKKEYVLNKLNKSYQPRASEYCKELEECYVNLIGKNAKPFEAIIDKIDELMEDDKMDSNKRVELLIKCYRDQLHIPKIKNTQQETQEERIKEAREFFKDETLCLKYSRGRYDHVLRDALCNVYLKRVDDTNDFKLDIVIENTEDEFINNYLSAMKTIFNNIWNRAKLRSQEDIYDICEKAIELSDDMIKNMSLCIVLTENADDANKLFEVLNDRSLKVEDLELLKNHFYKEYCTKSNAPEEVKDENIVQLDELWTDKIFRGNSEHRNRLISYLAAVYLTCDKELAFDELKLKNAIDRNYSSKYYSEKNYEYACVLSDFNVYYAMKIILSEFDIKAQRVKAISLQAENEKKSITYKTIHLLNALEYHSVIPAITNVILSTYDQEHSFTSDSFYDDFRAYVKGIIDDALNLKPCYSKIHKCAFMLWIAAIKGKDHKTVRSIAKRIIEKYGFNHYDRDDLDFLGKDISDLNSELDSWLNEWTYDKKKTFAVKVLLLNLLLCDRIVKSGSGYNSKKIVLKLNSQYTYNLDAGKIQLDHLEAEKVNSAIESQYYLFDDLEKRQKDVNGYIGNFMILDAIDNNKKNNLPLKNALDFYLGIEKSWLIEDIKGMINDDKFFEKQGVPKEVFFKERTRRLKIIFKEFLSRDFNQNEVEIDF